MGKLFLKGVPGTPDKTAHTALAGAAEPMWPRVGQAGSHGPQECSPAGSAGCRRASVGLVPAAHDQSPGVRSEDSGPPALD